MLQICLLSSDTEITHFTKSSCTTQAIFTPDIPRHPQSIIHQRRKYESLTRKNVNRSSYWVNFLRVLQLFHTDRFKSFNSSLCDQDPDKLIGESLLSTPETLMSSLTHKARRVSGNISVNTNSQLSVKSTSIKSCTINTYWKGNT